VWPSIILGLLVALSASTSSAQSFRLDFVLATPVSDAPEDKFGQAVAAAGRNILVGDPGDNTWVAALYDGRTGELLHVFHSPLPGQTQFGRLVAAAGDRLVVSQSSVAVHVFDAEGTFLRTLVPDNEVEFFGWSLAALNDRMLVGAPYGNPGAAYLFDAATGA